jgi:hypothetical protein
MWRTAIECKMQEEHLKTIFFVLVLQRTYFFLRREARFELRQKGCDLELLEALLVEKYVALQM